MSFLVVNELKPVGLVVPETGFEPMLGTSEVPILPLDDSGKRVKSQVLFVPRHGYDPCPHGVRNRHTTIILARRFGGGRRQRSGIIPLKRRVSAN